MSKENKFKNQAKQVYRMLIMVWCVVLLGVVFAIYALVDPNFSAFNTDEELQTVVIENTIEEGDWDKIENGIHIRTGFVEDDGLMTVVNNCTSCHSAKMVTQNRMTKERWISTIRWMQETQNLWDLGNNEEIIVNYLAKNYAPKSMGRRANLENIEWYQLN